MNRCHESGCRRLEFTFLAGVPCCGHSFAVPSLDVDGADAAGDAPLSPQRQSEGRMHLSWPSAVNFLPPGQSLACLQQPLRRETFDLVVRESGTHDTPAEPQRKTGI